MIDRQDVIASAREWFSASQERPAFVPGQTYVPPSGKVLDASDLAALIDASLDLWLTTGRFAAEFETALAKRVGARQAHLVNSGSSANLLAFSALTSRSLGERRIAPGAEVITVAAGFPTTVAPIVQNNAIPVFVDIDLATHNIDVSQLEAAWSERTRAVMLAHTLGNPFDLQTVAAFCKKHDLWLIEDCCDALGATFQGKHVGSFGDLATLSFYPAHHITMGEGGAVFGRSPSLLKLVESFRDWGRDCWCKPGCDNTCGKRFEWQLGTLPRGYDHKYVYSEIGYNLKATDMQAALGCSQLNKLDRFVEARRENHALLVRGLLEAGLDEYLLLPQATPQSNPSWFGLALTLKSTCPWPRTDVVRFLEDRRIGTRPVFAGNLLRQPAFCHVEHRAVGNLANTDLAMENSFWIGVWPGITARHIEYMVDTFSVLKTHFDSARARRAPDREARDS